jgi:hypothetical protein
MTLKSSLAIPFLSQALEGKIVSACAGMPLVLQLAGCRLRYKRNTEQWQVHTILCLCIHCCCYILSVFA